MEEEVTIRNYKAPQNIQRYKNNTCGISIESSTQALRPFYHFCALFCRLLCTLVSQGYTSTLLGGLPSGCQSDLQSHRKSWMPWGLMCPQGVPSPITDWYSRMKAQFLYLELGQNVHTNLQSRVPFWVKVKLPSFDFAWSPYYVPSLSHPAYPTPFPISPLRTWRSSLINYFHTNSLLRVCFWRLCPKRDTKAILVEVLKKRVITLDGKTWTCSRRILGFHTGFQRHPSWLLLDGVYVKQNQIYLKYKEELRSCSRENIGNQQKEKGKDGGRCDI